jgi:hypothetical protein
MKFVAASAFAALAIHATNSVQALTTEEAMCEKSVLDEMKGEFPDFRFPSIHDTKPRNPGLQVLKNKDAITTAIAKISNVHPKCATHLKQGQGLVEAQASTAQCQLWLEENFNELEVENLRDIELDQLPEPEQLAALCLNAAAVLEKVNDVKTKHSECMDTFGITPASLQELCIDAACIDGVKGALAKENPPIALPDDRNWRLLCNSEAPVVQVLQGAIETNANCAGLLEPAKTGLQSECLAQRCEGFIGERWSVSIPALAGIDITADPSYAQQRHICSNINAISKGITETLAANPECTNYVDITTEEVTDMCKTASCLAAVNDHLLSENHYAVYLYPTDKVWEATDKTPDELNAVCSSKEQISLALTVVAETKSECGQLAEDAKAKLSTGCAESTSKTRSQCDECLVGVVSLLRLQPKVDEVVVARHAGNHCAKVKEVAKTISKCEKKCKKDKESEKLAQAVIAHAQEQLARDGQCDVAAFKNLANQYEYVSEDGGNGDATVTVVGVVGGSVAGFAAVALVVTKVKRGSNVGVVSDESRLQAGASSKSSLNPRFLEL